MGTPSIEYVAAFAEIVTAVGTAGLAGATYWLARKTNDLAKDAEDDLRVASEQAKASAAQAEETRHLVEVSQQQTHRGQIPVVVPISMPSSRVNPSPAVVRVPVAEGRALRIPIVNAGVGPAIDIRATVRFLNDFGGRGGVHQPQRLRPASYTALAAGESAELRPLYVNPFGTRLPAFQIEIKFDDSFGVRYQTTATWLPDEEVFDQVRFATPGATVALGQ